MILDDQEAQKYKYKNTSNLQQIHFTGKLTHEKEVPIQNKTK